MSAPDAPEQALPPVPAQAPAPGTPAARARGLLWFTVLVLAVVIAAIGWFGLQYHAAVEALVTRVGAMDGQLQSLAGLSGRIDAGEQAVQALREELRAQDAARLAMAQELRGELRQGLARAAAPRDADERDLTLEESRYLVFAAGQRLALERDVATALKLLEAADQRLSAIEDPDLIEVRARLAEDIENLRNAVQPDIAALALFLADAAARADQLPLRVLSQPDSPLATIGQSDYTGAGWRGVLARIWRDLLGLVEVRDAQLADTEILDAQRQRLIVERLRLDLTAARSAALLRDSANLRAAAAAVESLLETYFAADAPAVQQLRERLAQAAALDLTPPLPGVGGSLQALRDYRASAAVRELEPIESGTP